VCGFILINFYLMYIYNIIGGVVYMGVGGCRVGGGGYII